MHIVSKLIPTLFALFVVALMPAFAHAATMTFRPITIVIPRFSREYTAPTPSPTPTPAPTPAPTPTPTPATTTTSVQPPTATYEAQLEQEVFAKINVQRAQNGGSALAQDNTLATLARAHSADMLAKNYFSHTAPGGCDPGCRLRAAGYSYSAYGENIYWMSGYSVTPAAAADMVVNAWMKSTGHRANILNATFTNQGIGVAKAGTKIYVTELLAKPR